MHSHDGGFGLAQDTRGPGIPFGAQLWPLWAALEPLLLRPTCSLQTPLSESPRGGLTRDSPFAASNDLFRGAEDALAIVGLTREPPFGASNGLFRGAEEQAKASAKRGAVATTATTHSCIQFSVHSLCIARA